MASLRDDDAAIHAYDTSALAQHNLDLARVLAPLLGEAPRQIGWLYVTQIDETPLGLRDDLVGDDQDIVVMQGEVAGAGGVQDDLRQIRAGRDLWDLVQADQLHGVNWFRHARRFLPSPAHARPAATGHARPVAPGRLAYLRRSRSPRRDRSPA